MSGLQAYASHEPLDPIAQHVHRYRAAGAEAEERGEFCCGGIDKVDLEEPPHVGDGVDERTTSTYNERDGFAGKVIHILTRPHHNDQPLLSERNDVSTREMERLLPLSAVNSELCAAKKALQSERERGSDGNVVTVIRIE